MASLYFVKRRPRPEWHNAPYHQYLICTRRQIAKDMAGASGERSWVWEQITPDASCGWLLSRWEGLDIDYGHVVHGFDLPDGTPAAFSHPHKNGEPWCLLNRAVWWSSRKMPAWLIEKGVIYPPDHFTQQFILDHEADDGCYGFDDRIIPAWWPVANAPVED